MVFLVGVLAAVFLGVGWVVQQRVAAQCESAPLMSWHLLRQLIKSPLWWVGIATISAGQTLSAWALQLGSVALVEPLLLTCLLVAFATSACLTRRRLQWQEIAGALVLAGSLGVFLAVASPEAGANVPSWQAMTIAGGLIGVAAAALLYLAKVAMGRSAVALECALIAAAAGAMYGLQDAATRAGIVALRHHSFAALLAMPWIYVMLAAATAAVLLSQSAFRAGRLDYALPPTAATQAIAGVVLGVGVMGDQLSITAGGLATEVICLWAMVAGTVLIARSPVLRPRVSSRHGVRRELAD
jgi:hypothetical protein